MTTPDVPAVIPTGMVRIAWNGDLTQAIPPDFRSVLVYAWKTSDNLGATQASFIGTLDKNLPLTYLPGVQINESYLAAFRSVDFAGNLSAPALLGFSLTTEVAATTEFSWISSAQDIQIFTVDGTWVRPPGQISSLMVYLIGGGGGGCSGMSGQYPIFIGEGYANETMGGDGGGGGARCVVALDAADQPDTVPVFVGQGGEGGSGHSGALYNAGRNGGTSSFGVPTADTVTPATPMAYGGNGGQSVYTSYFNSGIGGWNSYSASDTHWQYADHYTPGMVAFPGEDGGWGGCHPLQDAMPRPAGENGSARGQGAGAGGGGGGGILYGYQVVGTAKKGIGTPGGVATLPDGTTLLAPGGSQPDLNGWGGGGGHGGDAGYDETLDVYYAGLDGEPGGSYGGGGGGGGGSSTTTWAAGSGGAGAPGLVIVWARRGAAWVTSQTSTTWATAGPTHPPSGS